MHVYFSNRRSESLKAEHAIGRKIYTLSRRALNNIRVTFLLMRNKCKIINVLQNAKQLKFKYHRMFVMISCDDHCEEVKISFYKFK